MARTKTEAKLGPTDEQLQRLKEIEGKLLEVALEECDPDGWMTEEQAEAEAKELREQASLAAAQGDKEGAKLLLQEAKETAKQWKGERYWEKKNATATVSLLTKIELYRQRIEEGRQAGKGGSAFDDDKTVQAEIKAAEAKVKQRLSLVKKRAV